MNREIKFRGKSINSGKWVYAILHGFGMDWFDECVIESSIGQFTGFHDQNGKEIYEGDILRFYDNNKEYVCVVGWNNEVGAWCIRFKGEEYFGIRPLGEWIFEYKIEVIGNIYDNKELLEE